MTRRISPLRMLPDRVLTPRYPGLVYPNLVRGLVGAWSPCLTPERGTRLRDVSGRKNHGTLTNMDPATDWVTIEGRWALDFLAASSQYVSLGQVPGVVGATQLTMSAWMFRSATSNRPSVGRYIGNTRLGIQWYSDGKIYYVVGDGSASPYVFVSNTDTGWHHFGLVFSPSTITAYYDGVRRAPDGSSGTPPASIPAYGSDELRIGVTNGTEYTTGMIDDFLLYSGVAATDRHMAQLYSLGRGGWAEHRLGRRGAEEQVVAYTPFAELIQQVYPIRDRYVPTSY